jgi:hypothetical protein
MLAANSARLGYLIMVSSVIGEWKVWEGKTQNISAQALVQD